MAEPSARRLAPVGSEDLPGDERCLFGSQKDGGAGDLLRVAEAAKRHGLTQRGFPLRGTGETVEHASLGRTRRDGVNAHTRLGPFERCGLRQAFHGVLARGIDRATGRPFVTVGRGYVVDAVVTLRL